MASQTTSTATRIHSGAFELGMDVSAFRKADNYGRLDLAAGCLGVDSPIVSPKPVLKVVDYRPVTLKSKRTESLLSATRADSMFSASTST